jgi:hypothetical protein
MSRSFLACLHIPMHRQAAGSTRVPVEQKVAALIVCIASILLAWPTSQASAHSRSLSGDARAFAVSTTDGVGRPIGRWDPCTPIGYRVNATRAAPGALADVREAVRRVSRATGLTFIYRGTTTVVPQAKWADHAYPADTALIVAWIRPSQSTLWPNGTTSGSGQETVAGRSGAWYMPATDRAGRPWGRYDRGFVLLDQRPRFPAGFGTTGRWGSRGRELMHEMGHLVGLAHPHLADQQEVMYPELTRRPARWGRGDLAGLRIVGASGGCLHDVP